MFPTGILTGSALLGAWTLSIGGLSLDSRHFLTAIAFTSGAIVFASLVLTRIILHTYIRH